MVAAAALGGKVEKFPKILKMLMVDKVLTVFRRSLRGLLRRLGNFPEAGAAGLGGVVEKPWVELAFAAGKKL